MTKKPFLLDERTRREIESNSSLLPGWVLIGRNELYERIWSVRPTTLASELGMPVAILRDLCEELAIPKPPHNYWSLVTAGQTPPRTPLDVAREYQLTTLVLPSPEETEFSLTRQIAAERQLYQRIVVSDELRNPHPLIQEAQQTARRLPKRNKRDNSILYILHPLNIYVSKEEIPRALRLIDTLFKALEARGYKVAVEKPMTKSLTIVTANDQSVDIRLEEKVEQHESERAKEKHRNPSLFLWKWEKWTYTSTGIFVFTARLATSSSPKKWIDNNQSQLEDQLNDIVIGILKTAELGHKRAEAARRYKEEEKIRREQEEQRRREEELRRREEARRLQEAHQLRHEEEARRKALEEHALHWSQAEQIRELLQVYENDLQARRGPLSPDSIEKRWLQWAHAHADRLDPLKRGYLDEAIQTFSVMSDSDRKVTDPLN